MKDAPKLKVAKKGKGDPFEQIRLDLAAQFHNIHTRLDHLTQQHEELVKVNNAAFDLINSLGIQAQEDMEKAEKKEKSFLSWFFGIK